MNTEELLIELASWAYRQLTTEDEIDIEMLEERGF